MKRILGAILGLFVASAALADTVIITKTTVLSSTPTIDTGIYAAGDNMGGKLTLTGAAVSGIGTGVITSVMITDKDKEGADIDVVFFTSDPSATTFTNNGALTINDADLIKIVCVASVTTDVTFVDNGVSYLQNLNCPFSLGAANTTLYAAMVARSAPTYTGTTDLTLRVNILQD